MIRSRKTLLPSFALLALFLAACGGGSGGGGGGNDTDGGSDGAPLTDADSADVSEVALANSVAGPMEWVEVVGLPEGFDTTDGHVRLLPADFEDDPWAADEALILPLVQDARDDDDAIYLVAPLLDPEAIDTKLVISSGGSHSGELHLEILALPPRREGAIVELLDALEDMLEASTQALGKEYPAEWENWRADSFHQLPNHLLPLVVAWHEIANEDNPVALINREYDEDERELLERILAHRNRDDRLLVEIIEGLVSDLESGDTLLDEAAATTPVMTSTDEALTNAFTASRPTTQAPVTHGAGAPADLPRHPVDGQLFFPIHEPSDLAALLEAYANARILGQNIERATDIAEIGVQVLAVALPGGGASVVGTRLIGQTATRRVAAFLTGTAAGIAGVSAAAQWFLPCCIVDMDVDLDPADGRISEEDALANQVKLTGVSAQVESIGVNLARKAIDRALGKIREQVDAPVNAATDALTDSANLVTLEQKAVDEIIGNPTDPLFERIEEELPQGAEIVLTWKDIDLMGNEPQRWLEDSVATLGNAGEPIIAKASTTQDRYEFELLVPEAFDHRQSLLTIQTNTDELRAQVAGETRPINLDYIDLEFEPSTIRVEPDDQDPVTVTLTVHNAIEPWIETPLELEAEFGTIEQTNYDGEGVYTFEYVPPPDGLPDGAGIITVTATSISEAGIRAPANDPPPRTADLLITGTRQIPLITPRRACVGAGETQQYNAVDLFTGEDLEPEWSADGGSITQDGLFTASSGSGSGTVTATVDEESQSVTVVLGDCSCYFDASMQGSGVSANDGHAGNTEGFLLEYGDEGYDGIWFFGDTSSAETMTSMLFSIDPPIPAGGSGPIERTSTASIISFIGGESFSTNTRTGQGPNFPPLEFSITQRERLSANHVLPVLLEGTIRGDVWHFKLDEEGAEENAAFLNISFTASLRNITAGGLSCQGQY